MFKLAIEVCFENYFGLIHAIFLLLGSTKSASLFWDTRYLKYAKNERIAKLQLTKAYYLQYTLFTTINKILQDKSELKKIYPVRNLTFGIYTLQSLQLHFPAFQHLICFLKIARLFDCFISCGKFCHSLFPR